MAKEAKRILLVDDVQLFLELERTFLLRSGYEVFTAHSGRKALEMARTHRPHLILLDLCMPDMDGDECCKEIKSDPELKDTRVLMVTTADRQEDRARCIEAGCDGYLSKSTGHEDLVASIEKALNELVCVSLRLPIQVKVRYVPLGEEEEEKEGVTLNLSPTGMFIITEQPPHPRTKLWVAFQLPGLEAPLEILGEVVWNTPATEQGASTLGFGLRFTDVDEHILRRVERYVKEHMPQ